MTWTSVWSQSVSFCFDVVWHISCLTQESPGGSSGHWPPQMDLYSVQYLQLCLSWVIWCWSHIWKIYWLLNWFKVLTDVWVSYSGHRPKLFISWMQLFNAFCHASPLFYAGLSFKWLSWAQSIVLLLHYIQCYTECWQLSSYFSIFLFPQLVLEAHNVPELSAGVNCTFEDLAEMNGLVEGNRIKCFSPAEKEMPRIIVDKGKGNVPFAALLTPPKKNAKQHQIMYYSIPQFNAGGINKWSTLEHLLNTHQGSMRSSGCSPFSQSHARPRAISVLWIFVFLNAISNSAGLGALP